MCVRVFVCVCVSECGLCSLLTKRAPRVASGTFSSDSSAVKRLILELSAIVIIFRGSPV